MLLGNQFIWAEGGATFNSLTENSCLQKPRFTCLNPDSYVDQESQFSEEIFIQRYQLYNPGSRAEVSLSVLEELASEYNVQLVSFGTLVIEGASFSAPSISACAANITIRDLTSISASARGCEQNQGLGKGTFDPADCTAQGASGASAGGLPISSNPDQTCSQAQQPGINVFSEGSGGASLSSTGSRGGGVIQLSSSNMLKFSNSTIEANGENGVFSQKSAGGGAAGAIHIIARSVVGNGRIEAIGGNGSKEGGSGGSGGYISFALLNITDPRSQHLWEGSFSLEGGKGGMANFGQSGSGSPGLFSQVDCPAGHTGVLCAPCSIGYFKYHYG